jgi:hypothetical protein
MDDLVRILTDFGGILWQLLQLLVVEVGGMILKWSLLITWVALCLWAIDWRKMWPRLAAGAWAPLTLIAGTITLVWGWMFPSEAVILGTITLPNFWWQLLAMGGIVSIALICGWLQGVLGCYPAEVELQPATGDGHGHSHPDGLAPAHEH